MMKIALPGITEEEKRQIRRAYKELLKACDFATRPQRNKIAEAFKFALEAHNNTRRKSGELYIFHPVAVAMIVIKEIGLKDYEAVISALLHDSVEDTFVTLEDIEERFGKTVANIVEGLTKISGVFEIGSSKQLENFRRLLLTISEDIRVVLIKLADRLHNMRTLDSMKKESQLKIASETRNLYAPLAHRLGLYNIRRELDELAMKYLEPEIYNEIKAKLQKEQHHYEEYLNNFIKPIEKNLKKEKIKFDIYKRIKSIPSIWRKMKTRNITFEEVYDLLAIRIVINNKFKTKRQEIEACWKVYSIITSIYPPHPDRLRDWLSHPKSTGYEALHVTVMGPQGKWVEIQIRTKRMHEAAEKGPVAHWKYKEGKINVNDPQLENWINLIREVLEDKSISTEELWERIHKEINVEEIRVFTPKSEIITLPKDATALDFAYKIHTEIGNKAIAAKINHIPKPLNTKLRSGDIVEIITSTSKNAAPQPEWLNFVKTTTARKKIREALKEKRKQLIQKGKQIFDRVVNSINQKENLTISAQHPIIKELLAHLKIADIEEFYLRIGNHSVDLELIKKFIEEKRKMLAKHKELDPTISIDEMLLKQYGVKSDELTINSKEDVNYYFGWCCKPVAGDPIVAIQEPFKGISIHRPDCPQAQKLMTSYGYNIIKVRWNKNANIEFLAEIKITGQDRIGMLKDIVTQITDKMKVNIRSIEIDVNNDIFEGYIKLFIKDIKQLNQLIKLLQQINGVYKVERVIRNNNNK